jgi:hypothetical protein
MDDFEVIRFLAMDIITDSAYHAFRQKKSPFFAVRLPIGVPTFSLRPDRTVCSS